MLTVALEQLRFFAYHGFYAEEGVLGNDFLLDIYVSFPEPEEVEALSETVNYAALYDIAREAMVVPQPLLEQVVYDISGIIHQRFPNITQTKVALRKMNPPMAGEIRNSLVVLEKNY